MDAWVRVVRVDKAEYPWRFTFCRQGRIKYRRRFGLYRRGYFVAHPAISWPNYPRRLRIPPASGR